MEVTRNQIAELFQDGLNCTQIVLSHFCEKYCMEKEKAIRIGCGFGGGVREGELCGAVSGAIMVIGLKYGNSKAEDSKSKSECYQRTQEFTKKFREDNGSIVCKELLGCDISKEDGMKKAQNEGLFQTRCVDVVLSAIQILSQLGY